MRTAVAGYRVRAATAADAAALARHRVGMFRDMGLVAAAQQPPLEDASHGYLARALAAGEYRGWVAERGGAIAAGAGLLLRRLPPNPDHVAGGIEAYVLNVYTEPAHRRRGLARLLMDTVIAWCRAAGVARVRLHASDEGRPLYLSLGFSATSEMGRDLR